MYLLCVIIKDEKDQEVYVPEVLAKIGKFVEFENEMWKIVVVNSQSKFSLTELQNMQDSGFQIHPIIEI